MVHTWGLRYLKVHEDESKGVCVFRRLAIVVCISTAAQTQTCSMQRPRACVCVCVFVCMQMHLHVCDVGMQAHVEGMVHTCVLVHMTRVCVRVQIFHFNIVPYHLSEVIPALHLQIRNVLDLGQIQRKKMQTV